MKGVITIIGMTAIVFLLLMLAYRHLNMPVVQVDSVTGECVRVLSPVPDKYSCWLLPEKYSVEKVAPYWVREGEK